MDCRPRTRGFSALLFDVDLSRISRHINAIYNSKEQEPKGTLAENAIVQKEGTCPLPEKGTKKKLFLCLLLLTRTRVV